MIEKPDLFRAVLCIILFVVCKDSEGIVADLLPPFYFAWFAVNLLLL